MCNYLFRLIIIWMDQQIIIAIYNNKKNGPTTPTKYALPQGMVAAKPVCSIETRISKRSSSPGYDIIQKYFCMVPQGRPFHNVYHPISNSGTVGLCHIGYFCSYTQCKVSFFCLYIFFGFCITQYKTAILIYSQYYQWNRGDACISYGWINIIINPSQITVILKIAAMLYLILLALAPVAVTRNFTEKKTVSKPVVGIISSYRSI